MMLSRLLTRWAAGWLIAAAPLHACSAGGDSNAGREAGDTTTGTADDDHAGMNSSGSSVVSSGNTGSQGGGSDPASANSDPDGSETSSGSDDVFVDADDEILIDMNLDVAAAGCGDGILTEDEACDDGNLEDGDGCASTCLALEPGFSCALPGVPCQKIARCGDGLVADSEQCDDNNDLDGDGCSARCKVEFGKQCAGEPSVCTDTTCGDGIIEGAEACDDGNSAPFDGCSSLCLREPDCEGTSCTSECGDGLVINEECDDGNNVDGDGCSAACLLEAGFECSQESTCERINGECVLRVPTVFRDFSGDHSDFGDGNCNALTLGIVADQLDAEGRPVFSGAVTPGAACLQSAESFAEWYRDGDNNKTVVGDIVLWDNGDGGYVNRYYEDGSKWVAYTSGADGADGVNEMPAQASTDCDVEDCHPCSWDRSLDCFGGTRVEYDGNPLFFPVDDVTGPTRDAERAKVPEQYGYPGWPWEDDEFPGAPAHNFYFTSEVQYWFRYDAATNATLDFTGDDDVWVFINGHLAVDLGGIHVPENGSVTVNAASAADFALEPDNVYKITVFHAERRVEGSSFRLTLSGFEATPSDCIPICGDGVLSFGEECDDGDNDGGYGECDEGCKLGPYCGDGIVQENEDCDNGPGGGEGCPNCRILIIK